MKTMILELKSVHELRKKYPKCFVPFKPFQNKELMLESVVFPENRIPIYEWLTKIYNY